MDLHIKDQLFLVCGATSGLGGAIAATLLQEGAHLVAVARTAEQLELLAAAHPQQVTTVAGDITIPETITRITQVLAGKTLSGVVINAGGPPAATALESRLSDWDQAYQSVLRWKIALVQAVLPAMQASGYGRILFLESASVKQPMENLVLSNAMRLAVVGYAKTLATELAASGITVNILAPGFHGTAAMERLFRKKSEQRGITLEAAREDYIRQTPVGQLGQAADFASLAAWLLSGYSRFVTGQTYCVDGGVLKGTF